MNLEVVESVSHGRTKLQGPTYMRCQEESHAQRQEVEVRGQSPGPGRGQERGRGCSALNGHRGSAWGEDQVLRGGTVVVVAQQGGRTSGY